MSCSAGPVGLKAKNGDLTDRALSFVWYTSPNFVPASFGSTLARVTVLKFDAVTKLRANALAAPVTLNVPTVLGRLNEPDPSSGPVYPARSRLSTNAPTVTLPTSPTVPAPPPTRIVLPDTVPATLRALRAGTFGASPVPAMTTFDLKSPAIAGVVPAFALPLTVMVPTLGAAIVPAPTATAVREPSGAPVTVMSVPSPITPAVITVALPAAGGGPASMTSAPFSIAPIASDPRKPVRSMPAPT